MRLEEVVTTVRLIEFVDSLVWEEDEDEITRRVAPLSLSLVPVVVIVVTC